MSVPAASSSIVLLGASNLTRGLSAVLRHTRAAVGEATNFYCAAGRGRSYGMESRLLGRTLPGITQCTLWKDLQQRANEGQAIRALLTDVGNDILYGASVPQIIGWVEQCLTHLRDAGAQGIVVTGLPLQPIRALRPWRFQVVRAVFFPRHPIDFADAIKKAERVDTQLRDLAERFDAIFVEPNPEWYGFDVVHIRWLAINEAWRSMLQRWNQHTADRPQHEASSARALTGPTARAQVLQARPLDMQWMGVPVGRQQPSARFSDGSQLRMY